MKNQRKEWLEKAWQSFYDSGLANRFTTENDIRVARIIYFSGADEEYKRVMELIKDGPK